MYFTHVREGMHQQRRSYRQDALDTVVLAAKEWIDAALNTQSTILMDWAGPYTGAAHIKFGGLLVSAVDDGNNAVFEIRIALRSHNAKLWPHGDAPHCGLPKPSEPWCHTAVLVSPAAPDELDLVVIENALAWAWKELRSLRLA